MLDFGKDQNYSTSPLPNNLTISFNTTPRPIPKEHLKCNILKGNYYINILHYYFIDLSCTKFKLFIFKFFGMHKCKVKVLRGKIKIENRESIFIWIDYINQESIGSWMQKLS